jgi:hypothetical protein
MLDTINPLWEVTIMMPGVHVHILMLSGIYFVGMPVIGWWSRASTERRIFYDGCDIAFHGSTASFYLPSCRDL